MLYVRSLIVTFLICSKYPWSMEPRDEIKTNTSRVVSKKERERRVTGNEGNRGKGRRKGRRKYE